MRAAFRERSIVVNSILLPIFLYPFVLWVAFTGIIFVRGQTEGVTSRVVIRAWPSGHAGLQRRFEVNKSVELISSKTNASNEQLANMIRDGRLDAVVDFKSALETNHTINFDARITFDASRERSATAHQRVRDLIDDYRAKWLSREAAKRGVSPENWQQFSVVMRNVASPKQVGRFVLGLMLPVMFVVMVAIGCFFPAVDATAGEKERQTWESLMTTAASRVSIVTAKYLYVTSLGGLAGTLNLIAMAISVGPLLASLSRKGAGGLELTVPLAAIPVLLLCAVLLAGFIAGGMMVFAAFARTFKEGQATITPFYLLVLLPTMFLQTPGLEFTSALACVPVANIVLMARAALAGSFPPIQITLVFLVSSLLIAAFLRLAAWITQFEDVMLGSYSGSLFKFVRQRLLIRAKAPHTKHETS
jgi:sodium transport system permease protein